MTDHECTIVEGRYPTCSCGSGSWPCSNERDKREQGYKLLSIIQAEFCPTGIEQEQVAQIFQSCELKGEDVTKAMVTILYDGIYYNNWPWVK